MATLLFATDDEGDQIGRIFDDKLTVYFGYFFVKE
jgi:hypothetical protein